MEDDSFLLHFISISALKKQTTKDLKKENYKGKFEKRLYITLAHTHVPQDAENMFTKCKKKDGKS